MDIPVLCFLLGMLPDRFYVVSFWEGKYAHIFMHSIGNWIYLPLQGGTILNGQKYMGVLQGDRPCGVHC